SDGGKTWEDLRNGLPQKNCFDIVFRHSLAISGPNLVFGSTTGNLYLSSDYGDHWQLLSSHLARVDCLAFTREI
ncbi:MAG: glycosyl hydrolase, partial [Bacteroidetes bacterium]|nr:glycosyl hydrolase [Bacteroidota bacterium]